MLSFIHFNRKRFRFLCLVLCLTSIISISCSSLQESESVPAVTPTPTLLPHEIRETPVKLPRVIDRGLSYGEPCAPPCWEGIVPGSTTRDEVLQKLEHLQEEEIIDNYDAEMFYAYFPESGRIRFVFNGNSVEWIEIRRYRLYYQVGQILTDFGEPEGFLPREQIAEGQSCSQWRDEFAWGPSSTGYLVYPSQGVTFVIGIPDAFPGSICPVFEAYLLYYYQPRSLDEALVEERVPIFGFTPVDSEDIIPWHGFGPGY